MKTTTFVTALTLASSIAIAEEQQVFVCVSAVDGQKVIAERPIESEMGSVIFHKTKGDATVLPGLDGVTFLYIDGKDVWTLALHFPKMTYELSAHGSETFEDHGTCEESIN